VHPHPCNGYYARFCCKTKLSAVRKLIKFSFQTVGKKSVIKQTNKFVTVVDIKQGFLVNVKSDVVFIAKKP
jgi:hypothetical protein